MTDLERSIRDAARRHEPPADWLERIERRARTKRRNQRILAVAVGVGVSIALLVPLVLTITSDEGAPDHGGGPAAPGGACQVSVPVTNWWRWEGSGIDAVGGQDAQLVGDASFESGFIGQALTLDGDGDFAFVADDPSIEFGNDDFTFLLWVKFEILTGGEQIMVEKWVQREPRSSRGWSFAKPRRSAAAVGLYLSSDAALDGVSTDTLELPEDTWLHFAVRRRGDRFRIFLNGSAVATETALGDLATASSVKFGHRGGSSDTPGATLEQGLFLEGQLDEIMFVVGRALSAEEIETVYQEQLACSR